MRGAGNGLDRTAAGRHDHRNVRNGLLLRGGHLDIRALAAAQGSGFAELCRGGKLEKAGEEAAKALEGASLTAFERACDDALTESLCAARR